MVWVGRSSPDTGEMEVVPTSTAVPLPVVTAVPVPVTTAVPMPNVVQQPQCRPIDPVDAMMAGYAEQASQSVSDAIAADVAKALERVRSLAGSAASGESPSTSSMDRGDGSSVDTKRALIVGRKALKEWNSYGTWKASEFSGGQLPTAPQELESVLANVLIAHKAMGKKDPEDEICSCYACCGGTCLY